MGDTLGEMAYLQSNKNAEDIVLISDFAIGADDEVPAVPLPTPLGDSVNTLNAKMAENANKEYFQSYTHEVDVNEAYAVNADSHLTVQNYLINTNELVHPSMVFFKKPFNGYHYWMAYTPFDGGLAANENPSIAVSNDGITWATPAGLTNPVVPKPTDAAGSYNADTFLFLDKDGIMLCLVYKIVDTTGIRIVIRKSIDGITWGSEKTIIANADLASTDGQCPIIKWDGAKYNLWTVDLSTTPYSLVKRTCTMVDGTYADKITCTFSLPTGISPWHFDIACFGTEYHMVMQAGSLSGYGAQGELYFAKSTDGLIWIVASEPMLKRNYGVWDKEYYKPAIVPIFKNGKLAYKMWYTSANSTPWYLGYTEITFDKSERISNRRNKLIQGINNVGNAVVVDTFNKVDAATLGTAPTGQPWITGTGTTSLQIVGKKAVGTVAASQINLVDSGLANNYKISVKVNADVESWIVFRYSDGTHFIRFGKSGVGATLRVQKINGSATLLGDNLSLCKAGDILSVEVVNDVITCRVNGVLKYTGTDTFNNDKTQHGIQASTATASFSEFCIENLA